MPRTKENLHKHELIGLQAEVVQSQDETKERISGKVKDETKNILQIGEKKIPKKEVKFKFYLSKDRAKILDGESIAKRPEDRLNM